MKKILIIMALSILPMICNAQLNITDKHSKVEIESTRMGNCRLMQWDETFYIATISNYDDTFILYLGNSTHQAIHTIEDLLNLCSTIKDQDSISIDNNGQSCRISKGTMPGLLAFNQSGLGGFAEISKMEFKKFLKALKIING